MAKLPRLKTAGLVILAGCVTLVLLAAFYLSASSATAVHSVYLPIIHSGGATLEHGGFDPWPHVTITPTPEVQP